MKRLTVRSKTGNAYFPKCFDGCDGVCGKCKNETDYCEKLATYEDADEQGMLIRLPCKVGDTAYYVHKKGIDEVEVDSFVINVNIFANVSLYIGGERFGKTLTPYKTLFFTKAEAEAALERMG